MSWSMVRPGHEWIYDYIFNWEEDTAHSTLIKNDPKRSQILRIEHEGRAYIVKRYSMHWRRIPGYLVISSKAWREIRVMKHCEKAGILAPLPLAFGRHYSFQENTSYLLMTCIEGTPLKIKAKHRSWNDPELMNIMQRAGAAAQRLHALGFWHADLKLLHLVEQSDGQVGLIDLDGSKFFPLFLSNTRRANNLMQLYRNLAEHQLSEEAEDELAEGYLKAGGSSGTVKLFRKNACSLRERMKDATMAQREKNLAMARSETKLDGP